MSRYKDKERETEKAAYRNWLRLAAQLAAGNCSVEDERAAYAAWEVALDARLRMLRATGLY